MAIGMKELCALLIAGGIGAGSTVAVQKTVKPKPKPAAVKQVSKPAPLPQICIDMPISASPMPDLQIADIPAIDMPEATSKVWQEFGFATPSPLFIPPTDGGGPVSPPLPPPVGPGTPAVPDIDTWAQLVLGFGFLGMSLRRNRKETKNV